MRLPSRNTVAITVTALLLAALAAYGQVQRQALADSQRLLAAYGPSAYDIGFLQAMSAHHRQAITLARVLLAGPPSALAPIARGIQTTQTLELGEMRGWLRLWSQPLEVIAPKMDWMLLAAPPLADEARQYLLDCAQSPTGMAGLADDATVEAWRQTTGPALETGFITLMQAHHRGALPMARHAANHAQVPAVRALARQIAIEQGDELALLERLHAAQQSTAR
jgi:uncharacterized protein (DUF305 family)